MIQLHNISKAYKRYSHKYGRMAEWLGLGRYHEDIRVLREISFDVAQGQAVGIIGVNGAGKSTLLKIITGTTKPTTGTVQVGGHISALLELGMGFHPEFTGRQNCYVSGQLHGLRAREIDALISGIADFAEIGDYFDQPVRTYSSGMQVRLAFALATAKRPEVLIVDEALSVGDSYFQHKSFDRIRKFRESGTTLLFVSHDRSAIQTLCDRAILLENGIAIKDGYPEDVMDFYNALIAERGNSTTITQEKLSDGRVKTLSGTGEARVVDISILNDKGHRLEVIDVGQIVTLKIDVVVCNFIPHLVMGYGIRDRLGQVIYGTNTFLKKQILENVKEGEVICYELKFSANLGPGSYSIQTALTSSDTHLENNYEWQDLALVFNVVNVKKPHFEGCAWIDPAIRITRA